MYFWRIPASLLGTVLVYAQFTMELSHKPLYALVYAASIFCQPGRPRGIEE